MGKTQKQKRYLFIPLQIINEPAILIGKRSTYRALLEDTDKVSGAFLTDIVLDSLKLLYAGTSKVDKAQANNANTQLRREAMHYILQRLGNPDLSNENVALNLNITVRQLQRAFISSGCSPKKFMINKRLDQAAQILHTQNTGNRPSIIQVSYDVGFNDPSNFSHSFSRRYGVSPKDYKGALPLSDA